MPKKDTKLQKLSENIYIAVEELQSMLVNIMIQLVTVAGKELDEYLYRDDELGCCIRDVIAVAGKEPHIILQKRAARGRKPAGTSTNSM